MTAGKLLISILNRPLVVDDQEFITKAEENSPVSHLIDIAVLNSRIIYQRLNENSPVEAVGDATELGLHRFDFVTYFSNPQIL